MTALRSNGSYLQMPLPGDNDPSTSDAVFVFTSSAPGPAAAIGNSVCVTGAVQEFMPDAGYGTITEISGTPVVTQLSTDNPLPAPVVLTTADFNPNGGLYQREKYEGMRVSVNSLTVIAPSQGTVNEANATATSSGIFFGVLPGVPRPFREPGVDAYDTLPAGSPGTIPVWDDNPEILRVNTTQLAGGVPVDVTTGAIVSNLTGVLDYKFGQYTLLTDPRHLRQFLLRVMPLTPPSPRRFPPISRSDRSTCNIFTTLRTTRAAMSRSRKQLLTTV